MPTTEQIYITVNPFDRTLRHYSSIKSALYDSIDLNDVDDTHPAFELYELKTDKSVLTNIGTLVRKFGTNDFNFINKHGEKVNT